MRNGYHGFSFHELRECQLNLFLTFTIESRCRFIEYEDGCILQDRTSNDDSLTLSSGEFHAAFTDKRFVSLRKLSDKLMCLREFCCLFDLILSRILPPIADIFSQRSMKQDRVLWDKRDMPTERVLCHVCDVLVIEENLSVIDVILP